MAKTFLVVTAPHLASEQVMPNDGFLKVAGVDPALSARFPRFGVVHRAERPTPGFEFSLYERKAGNGGVRMVEDGAIPDSKAASILKVTLPDAALLMDRTVFEHFARHCREAGVEVIEHPCLTELKKRYPDEH